LTIMIIWRTSVKGINGVEDSNDLTSVMTMMKMIFSITEDLPQLTFHTMFCLRAVFEPWDGIVDQVSWVTVAGVVTSCLSLSKNFASYASGLNSSTSIPLIF
ncbi:unnamed protein product, partial [Meganyctiphanes norvegica]